MNRLQFTDNQSGVSALIARNKEKKMKTSDTKTGLVRAILCLLLIAAIVCIGIVVFYAVVFHHEPFIEPSIDLTGLEKVYDSPVIDGDNTYSINGSDYEIYCKLDLRNKDVKELSFGGPIAYVNHLSPAYYEYFSPITDFPDGEWLVSFKESGNGGVITKKNSLYILRRTDVDEIPDWLIAEHSKFKG